MSGVPQTQGVVGPRTAQEATPAGDAPQSGTAEGEPGARGPAGDEPGGEGQAPGPMRRMPGWAATALGVFLLADLVVVCGALLSLWPVLLDVVRAGAAPGATSRWSPFGLGGWALTADTAMLLAVICASALGSFVHAATSFATYVGNRRLYASWLWWYLLRAGIGVALALLVYFLLRGGLFTGSSGPAATNPYGFAGIAGLCGLFSKQATDKLREVCDTILSTRSDGDRDRRDKLASQTPDRQPGAGAAAQPPRQDPPADGGA
ncbi:hypothetical protein [Streptomyces sp. Ru71]|uniref:hypothetical protein n=1 Tax=Streptomyces sp. Ru71 TaxID=2080746 RepID=UPI00215620E8|nr:hypothetical protein [Streptomyces sp. Ru71]